ncbi:MAG: S8 family peptidase [Anaerostipes sp.]|uniref:S8 family peptidase n=1 Tax=Anaerostipes sp. TaxID=1872530 RepID=UPI003991A456
MKILNKIMTVVLVMSMAVSLMSEYVPSKVLAKEKEKDYVIVTKSQKAAKNLESKYENLIQDQVQKTDLLEEEHILVSKLTETEAEIIEKDQQVLAVEEDINVSASDLDDGSLQNTDEGTSWNLKSIHVDEKQEVNPTEKVKVALLDSGIDYQEGLEVKERVNLIAEDEEISPMFEDASNHGTSIASLLVSQNNKVDGINQNIELYSARILDEKKQAPISRVVEGIYWAIEKDVNIISISFGTNQYSQALQQAVDDANKKGILVIAAAGNQGEDGTDNVEYPAAFDNVIAVGSVNSKAEISDFSSTGKEVDVVAPGEAVRATGAFGETMVTSGTSMAVPHVVGTASLLWQKDTSKSKEFIKDLLEESARPLGDKETYGKGIIDYEYAEKVYPTAEEQYQKGDDIQVKENTKSVKKYDNTADEAKVEGTWSSANHQKYLTDKGVNLPAMKKGAAYPDTKASDGVEIYGMTENPDFHGLYERRHSNNEAVNYLASYRFMIKIGNEYGKGKTYTEVTKDKIPGLTATSYSRIRSAMSKIQKKSFFKNYSNANKKAFIFGMAMHTSTDTFAHSTFRKYNGQWYSITHAKNPEKGQMKENEADNPSYVPARFKMAYRAERNTLYRYQGKRSEVAVCHDFHAAHDPEEYYPSNPTFKVKRLSQYGAEVNISDKNVIAHFATINY